MRAWLEVGISAPRIATFNFGTAVFWGEGQNSDISEWGCFGMEGFRNGGVSEWKAVPKMVFMSSTDHSWTTCWGLESRSRRHLRSRMWFTFTLIQWQREPGFPLSGNYRTLTGKICLSQVKLSGEYIPSKHWLIITPSVQSVGNILN